LRIANKNKDGQQGCWQNPPGTIVDEALKPTVEERPQSLQIGENLAMRSDSSDSLADSPDLR
jgi:hypothetical protein